MKKIMLILFVITIFGCKSNIKRSDAYGNFESDETILSSEIGGKIVSMNYSESDEISKGAVLAIIDTTQLFLQIQNMKTQQEILKTNFLTIDTQIEVLKKQKDNLIREKIRSENLIKERAIPQKLLDEIIGNIDVIEKQMENVKSKKNTIDKQILAQNIQIKSIQDKINRCYISSPIKATILESYHKEGEIVPMGSPLFKIANMKNLTLSAYVSGSQLSEFQLGQIVKVMIDKSENEVKELSGKITHVSSQAEFTPKIVQTREQRTSLVYKIKVSVKNEGSLKIGMPAEVVWKK